MATKNNQGDLTVSINGTTFGGWEALDISRSMDDLAGAFSLSTANFFKDGIQSTDIKKGDDIVIKINGQKVITGYIDSIDLSYSAEKTFFTITGRDKTADLIDSDFAESVTEWKKQSVGQLIKNLCNPFDIDVVIDDTATTAASKLVDTFTANPGDEVYHLITRLCRDYAIIPLSYGDGKLYLTRVGTKRKAADGLQYGVNVKSGIIESNNENRFKKYIVKGIGVGNDDKQLSDFISPSAEVTDSDVERERVMTFFLSTNADNEKCKTRAKWEKNYRAGLSNLVSYGYENWVQQSKDKIFEINSLVNVNDSFLDLNREMLIYEVRYYYENGKDFTDVIVVDKNTFSTDGSVKNSVLDR